MLTIIKTVSKTVISKICLNNSLTDFLTQKSHINFTYHILHWNISVLLFWIFAKQRLVFTTSASRGGMQVTCNGSRRNMSTYWLNTAGIISVVDTKVTSHCQEPILPRMSVVTSSCIVPILKSDWIFNITRTILMLYQEACSFVDLLLIT